VPNLTVITPVFNDWDSFRRLVREIDGLDLDVFAVHIIAVDDGSLDEFEIASLPKATGAVVDVEILHLALNLGHQRAIAVGLAEAATRENIDWVLVLDCDGEDKPADIPALLATAARSPNNIVLAARGRRSENARFLLGYRLYKVLCRALIGKVIDFGNFSLLPAKAVRRLSYMPELWNSLPAAILRSRIPHNSVPCDRGSRYAGTSKMNTSALVAHGLSAVSVYADIVFSRLLVYASIASAFAVISVAVALILKFVVQLATPGWMTTAVGIMLILLTQMLILTLNSAIIVLFGRNSRGVVPILDCRSYVAKRQKRRIAAGIGEVREGLLTDHVASP
jgi:polyisoprenyl-phosphate glycosyltransferase